MKVRRVPRYDLCWEEGCDNRGMPCYFTGSSEKPDAFYCTDHTHKNGVCWGCGYFWAGIESFDFNLWGNELCDNCKDNSDLTGEWYEDEDDEYDFDYPDEAYMEEALA